MNEELKKEAREEFDEVSDHIVPKILMEGKDALDDIKSFIDSLIDRTVQRTEEKIVGVIEEVKSDIEDDGYGLGWNNSLNKLIPLITNKSDINKVNE